MEKLEIYEKAKQKLTDCKLGEGVRVVYGNSEFEIKRTADNVFHCVQKLISNGHTMVNGDLPLNAVLKLLDSVIFN